MQPLKASTKTKIDKSKVPAATRSLPDLCIFHPLLPSISDGYVMQSVGLPDIRELSYSGSTQTTMLGSTFLACRKERNRQGLRAYCYRLVRFRTYDRAV
jgi:hypothetical protein